MRKLTGLEQQLIDRHFEFAELSRSYSPSGIYARVQAFIDNGLDEALSRHDADCEMSDGFRRWCDCAHRRSTRETPVVLDPWAQLGER